MGKRDFYQEEKIKRYVYVFGITLILSIVIFLTIFVMYNKKMKKEASIISEDLGMIEDIVSNDNLEETSSSSDLGIKDKESNTISNTTINNENKNTKIKKEPIEATVSKNNENLNKSKNENINNVVSEESNKMLNNIILENNISETSSVEEKLEFETPVVGEIIKDFAMDNLIFSNTLEEWTTHQGIDIKAEKTSIVVAAEDGTIESIKNDPRYGLTITIAHSNGFKTIYSNLLTTEFVSENETVEKGQTIATVGETASFEVADESHLHFEMYKDGVFVNPTIYLK